MSYSAQQKLYDGKYVDNNTGDYPAQNHQTRIFLSWLKAQPPPQDGQRPSILDLGGGICDLGLRLRQAGMIDRFDYVNIEMSEQAARNGRRVGFDKIVMGVIPEEGFLPFRDEQFDMVHCSHVVEHVVNPDVIFSEAFRILKPGGTLFVATPNLASWIGRILILFGWQGYGQEISTRFGTAGKGPLGRCVFGEGGINYHLRLFTLAGLKDMMRLHGFRVVKVAGARMFDGVKSHGMGSALVTAARMTERVLAPFPSLANNILCLGQKPRLPADAPTSR